MIMAHVSNLSKKSWALPLLLRVLGADFAEVDSIHARWLQFMRTRRIHSHIELRVCTTRSPAPQRLVPYHRPDYQTPGACIACTHVAVAVTWLVLNVKLNELST